MGQLRKCRWCRIVVAVWGMLPLLDLALIAGCQPLPDVPPSTPPSPVAPPLAAAYQLQPGDQFDVHFFFNPELNESVTIQPDGRYSVLMAQDAPGAGMTLAEIRTFLNERYQRELKDPRVTVTLKSSVPTRIYVGGEVNSPGEYASIGPPLSLTQAIARAAGTKNSANLDQIILLRRGPGGTPKLYNISFNDATTGANPSADILLQPYDSLFVPRTPIANTYLAFQQYFQQFVPDSFGYSIGATFPK
jgi:polysaccharide export outer membrane protein